MFICIPTVIDYVACLFGRMMMLLMQKLLSIRLHFWLTTVSRKSWIYSIRFDIIGMSMKMIVVKATSFSILLNCFLLFSSLSGLLCKNFRFEEEVLGSSITLLWHITNWKTANRRWVCFFSFGILPMLIQLFHKVVIVVLSLISSVVSHGC